MEARGDYFSIVNCRKKNSRDISTYIWNFLQYLKCYVFFPRFLAVPPVLFRGTLGDKHCSLDLLGTSLNKPNCTHAIPIIWTNACTTLKVIISLEHHRKLATSETEACGTSHSHMFLMCLCVPVSVLTN